MVTRVPISLGGTGESSQPSAQAALGLHSSNSVAFSAVTINSVNVLSNDYATYATLAANDYATYQNALSNAYANDLVTYNALKITVQDEGNQVYTAPSTLNFVGSGVSVSNTGSVVTVTVTGGGGGGDGTISNEYSTYQNALSNAYANDYSTYATLAANDYATYQNALSNAYANDYATYQNALSNANANDYSTYATLAANDYATYQNALSNAYANDYATYQNALSNAYANDYATYQNALSNAQANDYSAYTVLVANDYATYQNALSNAYANDYSTYSAVRFTVQDEGSNVYTLPSIINFIGTGVTVSNTGSSITVAISSNSSLVNATNDTSTATLYPVMVGAAGSEQIPKVTTSKLVYNASEGSLNLTDGPLIRAAMKDYALVSNSLGNATGNVTVNLENGNYFTATTTGATVWTFSNPPGTDRFGGFILKLVNGGSQTQTWPSVKWPSAVAPTLTSSGTDILVFITDDTGTTWRGVASMLDSR